MTRQDSHTYQRIEPLEATTQLISLVIPIYNEGDHLQEFLERIDSLKLEVEKELIIIDDCSKDNSLEIIKNFPFKSSYKLIEKNINEGKGSAIRTGFDQATGTIIGVQDADFEYDINDLSIVLEPILSGAADVVYGSRYKNSLLVHRTFHYLVNRILTMFSNLASGLFLSDMETCYKFFKADIIKSIVLESQRFGFEPEITAKIGKLKLRIAEVPISYFPRNYIEGKKITWKDGIAAVGHIIRYNYFTSWDKSFKKSLPEKYIPRSHHWL